VPRAKADFTASRVCQAADDPSRSASTWSAGTSPPQDSSSSHEISRRRCRKPASSTSRTATSSPMERPSPTHGLSLHARSRRRPRGPKRTPPSKLHRSYFSLQGEGGSSPDLLHLAFSPLPGVS